MEKITGVDKDLSGITETENTEIESEEYKNGEEMLFIEPSIQCLLLYKLADNLGLNEIFKENLEEHETDGFMLKIKELVERIFEELKGKIGDKNCKKVSFVKAIIIIFSIILNANISSAKKIKKIIKQSASLALKLWPKPSLQLEDSSHAIPNQGKETKELQDKETDNSSEKNLYPNQ